MSMNELQMQKGKILLKYQNQKRLNVNENFALDFAESIRDRC